jgi:flagellar basal body-associated protein FliL
MKKNNKGLFVIFLMVGIFMTLVGAMGYIRSVEITDIILIISGLVMAGSGVYRLVVPFKEK